MEKNDHVVFAIGFPGAVACEVATALATQEGIDVRLLVSPEHRKEARQFVSRLKREITIVEGSDTRIDFGLSGKSYLKLAEEVETILQLNLPHPPGSQSAEPEARTAAREIIELGLEAKRLKHVITLSHLDVAGHVDGVFAEWDLDLGQGFSDQLQEDRFRAERVFRRFMDKMPITVARSGWISGTGRGLCPLVHLLLAMDDPASAQIKDPDAGISAIDIGTLSGIIVGLIPLPPANGGRTLHLTYADLPAIGDLVAQIKQTAQELVPAGFELFTGAKRVLRRGDKEHFWSVREFLRRQPAKARISTSLTERFLNENGLTVPRFDPRVANPLIARAVEEIVGFR
jgi:hypothetical protein